MAAKVRELASNGARLNHVANAHARIADIREVYGPLGMFCILVPTRRTHVVMRTVERVRGILNGIALSVVAIAVVPLHLDLNVLVETRDLQDRLVAA